MGRVAGADAGREGCRPAAVSSPAAGLLSNGRYTVLLGAAGTGCSWNDGYALTRWRSDRVEDHDGFFVYLRDRDSGVLWSAALEPVQRVPESYECAWQPGRFAIARVDDGIETRLEACVVADAPLEIRRVTLRNHSCRHRRIEITSYAEVVLNRPATDAAHPAFSRLFVQTEFVREHRSLLARRRPRGNDERHPWLVHALVGEGGIEHETDRARFLGRGRGVSAPHALTTGAPLSGTTGNVLDPVASLRRVVDLAPGARAQVVFLLGAAPGRDEALAAVGRWSEVGRAADAFEQAQVHERRELERLALTEAQAEHLQALAAAMLYGVPVLRSALEISRRAAGDPAGLRRYGLEAERPLVVLHAERPAAARHLPDVVQAHRYWQALGLPIQTLVLCDGLASLPLPPTSFDEDGFRIVSLSEIPESDRDLVDALARLVVTDGLPVPAAPCTFTVRESTADAASPVLALPGASAAADDGAVTGPEEPLLCFNGYGGFTRDGREYVIRLEHRDRLTLQLPPMPWINVVANEHFGFLVSETGAGFTWSQNSRQHRLTPWSNDPVSDPHGEALYVRDEASGAFWSPLPGPTPGAGRYEMRHGFGYSRCRHFSEGLDQETSLFVPRHDAVKIARVRLTNRGARKRRLSLFAYQRLVLGGLPEETGRFVATEIDEAAGAILARNRMGGEHASRVAFAAVVAPEGVRLVRHSGDRESFIGRRGSPARPAALCHAPELDGRAGEGLDPCFASQVILELHPGEPVECAFLLGEGSDPGDARALLARCRQPGAIQRAFDEVTAFWCVTLSGIRIETPVPAIDLMVNGWLAYQALSCRIWGRSAHYQSGGAFGFRDQLQDSGALTLLLPELARKQILLHAGHQFVEGDVLHWWHPPSGRGIRTRIVDDLLWLPSLTTTYIQTTGDWSILDERVRFLEARPLAEQEEEAYLLPSDSGQAGDLYEHCCRAIDRSLATGRHGLPLFGTGDWNDGMNRVGREGRGESVWMGFFLYAILGEFLALCDRRGDHKRALCYRDHRARLSAALNESGWDGAWYLRGWYDGGEPLGSRDSEECRIDALAQAWAVMSGAAPLERAAAAMDAVERHLLSEPEGLIRLLTPAFGNTARDPGYIKGYPPGVRENGGQYTHAALWVVRAMAELGRNDRAARLLEMLSPVCHALTPGQVEVYKVEPYVVAADVYGEPPHVGRGGWSWYTGSAGWMYRVALESVLGLRVVNGDVLLIRPCVPDRWPQFKISFRLPGATTRYDLTVRNPHAAARAVIAASVDGAAAGICDGVARIPLARDGRVHTVEVVLGPAVAAPDSPDGTGDGEAVRPRPFSAAPDPAPAEGRRSR